MQQKEKIIWDTLKKAGFNDYGVAGLMGNLLAESGLNPINLEDTKNKTLGLSDIEYTKRVDNFSYKNFVHDGAGYGIAQWTWWTRKQALLSYARRNQKSIGDLEIQLAFLVDELKTKYTNSVYNVLKNATSVKQASDAVFLHFEQPYDQSFSMQTIRSNYGESYYLKYSKGGNFTMSNQKYIKGKKVQLSKHFSSLEMDCHGQGCCSETLINPKLIGFLEMIRNHFGKPITITSGYRCPIHNRNVGGATGSRHAKGDAADIVIQGIAPREVAKYAESAGILGIGLYETPKDGFFVHIDTRDKKSFWYGQRQEYRSTFGGVNNEIPSTKPEKMYMLGSKGPGVEQLQENLISLGYSVGKFGADGQFGAGTSNAVKDFQKDNHLSPDGIAGPDTLDKINHLLNKNTTSASIKEVTANILNVRLNGDINAPVINQLLKGEKVKLLESKEGWGRIESPKGWVSLTYLK